VRIRSLTVVVTPVLTRCVQLCAIDLLPGMGELLELADLPSIEFRSQLVGLMLADLFGTLVSDFVVSAALAPFLMCVRGVVALCADLFPGCALAIYMRAQTPASLCAYTAALRRRPPYNVIKTSTLQRA
jgi:hypothetical protein